jgi:hypothetical protein
MKNTKSIFLFILLFSLFFQACQTSEKSTIDETAVVVDNKKIGVLLVNHGSPSETWRNALLQLEKEVTDSVLSYQNVAGIKTAFMEYTEPSIATRLKEFDKEGYSDVVIIPIFLTVSPHSFEDIPTIIGQKEDPQSMETLKLEKIERYKPKAQTHLTPLLDFTDILQKNILRRAKALSKNPENEGLVLIGYGDEAYDKEWKELFDKVGLYVKTELGISEHSYGWCGHIAHYKSEETTKAIEKVLKTKNNAVVIPVLVAHDENFQIRIIGGGVEKIKNHKEKVAYKPDALLPDENIQNWVKAIAKEYVAKLNAQVN